MLMPTSKAAKAARREPKNWESAISGEKMATPVKQSREHGRENTPNT